MSEQNLSIHDRIMQERPVGGHDANADVLSEKGASMRAIWWGRFVIATGAVVFLTASGIGLYQYPVFAETTSPAPAPARPAPAKSQPKANPKPAQRQAQPSSTSSVDPAAPSEPFGKHAADAGLRACGAMYAGLGKALTEGAQYVVQTQSGKTEADRHSVQGLVGMTYQSDKGYSGPAAGLVFAAPVGQGCEGTMVRVVPFQQNCQAAAALLPQGSKALQPLAGIPVVDMPTGGQAMLMPAGQGCIAISVVRAG